MLGSPKCSPAMWCRCQASWGAPNDCDLFMLTNDSKSRCWQCSGVVELRSARQAAGSPKPGIRVRLGPGTTVPLSSVWVCVSQSITWSNFDTGRATIKVAPRHYTLRSRTTTSANTLSNVRFEAFLLVNLSAVCCFKAFFVRVHRHTHEYEG